MVIQQYMGVIKSTFCIVLVLNIVAAVVTINVGKKETEDEFITQLFDPASGLLDEDTVRLASLVFL